MSARIFIDGEAGTTGLEIRERLAAEPAVEVASIAAERRKDPDARRELMAEADLVVLCLPDAAAIEAVALADTLGNRAPRIVDASTAHRVAEGWVYGFPELDATQADAIRNAQRVANPGCYPTGAIALLRPLVDAGLLTPDYPVTVNAVSGYSGGGKSMIESYEVARTAPAFELYALGLAHKHVPELLKYSGLKRRPIFVPSVGNFRQGMLVSVPLHLDRRHSNRITAVRRWCGWCPRTRARSSTGASMRWRSTARTSSSFMCLRTTRSGRRCWSRVSITSARARPGPPYRTSS
jgi:N-acetyl-gamma-glutamyl-phosphate reductase